MIWKPQVMIEIGVWKDVGKTTFKTENAARDYAHRLFLKRNSVIDHRAVPVDDRAEEPAIECF